MSRTPNISYCADMLRGHDRDLYYLTLFVAEPQRAPLVALYALNTELSHIRRMVSEEMIGHIRYAWWRETLEGLYAGQPRAGHPVLEELLPILSSGSVPPAQMLALVSAYADHYPEPPQGHKEALETITLSWLAASAPNALRPWKKASTIVNRHRSRHGMKYNSWLALRLLVAGCVGR